MAFLAFRNFCLAHPDRESSTQIDYLTLTTAALGAFTLLYRFFWRGRSRHRVVWITCLLVASLLGAGWFFVDAAGSAPTDGSVGSWRVSRLPLRRRWRRRAMLVFQRRVPGRSALPQVDHRSDPVDGANRLVHNIQTLRRLPDGRRALIFDSERDRENDGRIHTEAEKLTRTSEVSSRTGHGWSRFLTGQPCSMTSQSVIAKARGCGELRRFSTKRKESRLSLL